MKKFFRLIGSGIQGALIILVVVALILFSAFIGRVAWDAQLRGKTIMADKRLTSLAEQGEFVGGHYSTVLSAVTLALLVYTSFAQARAARKATIREMFSSGIDAVARYDIKEAGCPQALRILDYYSRMALDYDDRDYYLFLNTVMTGPLRDKLEEPNCSYRFAQAARDKISRIQALLKLRDDLGWWRGTWRFFRGRYKR
jgi:hypothetical protein